MKNISIKKILKLNKKLIGKKITIYGLVKTIRNYNKNIIFIDINDGSSLKCIQIIIKNNNKINIKEINKISSGFSIKVIGKISLSIGNKQNIELIPKKIKIIGKIINKSKYPLSPKKHSFEYLRKIIHLRPRTYFFSAVSRIRNSIFYKIHNFMNKNNFIWVPSPIITSFDTEGASEVFNINNKNNNFFFNKKVFLTVSGQLHIETYTCSIPKIYTLGPVFRAENSNTRKHLAEFWMLEVEISFVNIKKLIKFTEYFIKKIIKYVLNNNIEDINYINKKNNKNTILLLKNILDNKFIVLKYYEVLEILNKNNFYLKWGDNINTYHEKFLINYFNSPIFIIEFPLEIKPFYMKVNKDKKTTLSMDLIFPEVGEIVGGSERENIFNKLKKVMKKNNIKNNWYLDLRKYSSVPHSGFGMGLERFLLLITGIDNIRDVSAFPRFPGNFNC